MSVSHTSGSEQSVARSVPDRSPVLSMLFPYQRPASPEMYESPSDTIASRGELGYAAAALGTIRHAMTAASTGSVLRIAGP
jgi:hypothetical protein